MPRLKKKETPHDRLLFLLRGYELRGERLASVLGCSRATAFNRLRDPGSFTLDELRKINHAGVPIEELRQAL